MSSVGRLGDEGLVNVRQFTCTCTIERWNGITQRMLMSEVCVTSMRSRCQTAIKANDGHTRYYVSKFYTCIDVIKRNASDQIAINYEFFFFTEYLHFHYIRLR